MNDCFDKSRRLLTKKDYAYVFEKANKLSNPYFVILYRDNALGHARLGMALSKRVLAKAHDRNKIKRLLRESFRVARELPAVDIVVLAKPNLLKVDHSLLIHKLRQVWSKF